MSVAFFPSSPKWAKACFRVMLEYSEIKKAFRYYIKIDSMLPCVCSVIDHRICQNVVRTSVTHLAMPRVPLFLFLPYFDVICDLLLTRHTATWNLFVKQMHGNMESIIDLCNGETKSFFCFKIFGPHNSKAGLFPF